MLRPAPRSQSRAILLVGVLMASACISAHLAPTVVSYNLAVEKAQNEMLLLNIVRAAKRKPMYLVDVSKITGSLKRDITGQLAAPFGGVFHGGTSTNNVATVTGTYSVNPTFDVNVLSSAEFMTGFLQPVTTDQIAYFLDQAWPAAFLLHLLVVKADVYTDREKKEEYYNHPSADIPDETEFRKFSAWATKFASQDLGLFKYQGAETIGSAATAKEAADLRSLVARPTDELTVRRIADNEFELTRQTVALLPKKLAAEFPQALPCPLRNASPPSELPAAGQLLGLSSDCHTVILHLRSPEGILYYLGQIVRLEAAKNLIPEVLIEHGSKEHKWYRKSPLFVALPKRTVPEPAGALSGCPGTALTMTDEDGDTYFIPRLPFPPLPIDDKEKVPITADLEDLSLSQGPIGCRFHMSNDVLTLLTQLIALHKSAKDIGTTPLVRAIGS